MHTYITFPITFQFTQNLVHSNHFFVYFVLIRFILIIIYSELFVINISKLDDNRIIIS